MLLYSLTFIAFFAFVFLIFWLIPGRFQWIIILLSGYYFYASWKPAYLGIIILATVVSYCCALFMYEKKQHKKLFLFLALLLNISFLFIFKYFNFFSVTLNQTFKIALPQFKIMLPLGISFFTLQVIGYLLDVYKGKIQPEKHLGIFASYVCFFPQLSAGPIERGASLLPQLRKHKTFEYACVSEGARLFAFGLFKKMVIADNLAVVVDRVFFSLPEYKGLSLMLTVFFYSWQIYMDFSGYTDMARGTAKMLGVNLRENFNSPYLANSVQNFWRRWHISFSSWLRDYVYIPLGGSRKGFGRTIINTLIVFALSGLWHGAAWTFIVWGVLHGVSISLEKVLKKVIASRVTVPGFIKIVYTYSLISIFWIFFRADSLQDALYFLQNSLVGLKNFLSPGYILSSVTQVFAYNTAEAVIIFSLVLLAIFMELSRAGANFINSVSKQPAYLRWAAYGMLMFLIIQLRNAEIKEFIYLKF